MISATQRKQMAAGQQLTAKYKGETHECAVLEGEDRLMYRLADGREFKSPSAAGSAVMGGIACNGWRFWSVVGEEAESEAEPAMEPEPRRKGQSTKHSCEACGKSFMSAKQLQHHRTNAERLCKPA